MEYDFNFSKSDILFGKTYVMTYMLLMLKNMMVCVSPFIFKHNGAFNSLIGVISVTVYMLSLVKYGIYRIRSKQMLAILMIAIYWIATYALVEDLFSYQYVKSTFTSFLLYSVPAFIFIPMISDIKVLMYYYYKHRYWFAFGTVCTFVLYLNNGIAETTNVYNSYSMALGRAIMFPCILFYSSASFFKKRLDYLICFFCVAVIFICGSRFPLLCVFSYILIRYIFDNGLNKRTLERFIFLLILLVMVVFFGKHILKIVTDIFDAIGIESRNLKLFFNGMFISDSGRGEIRKQLYKKLIQSPIWGYGAGGGNRALDDGLSHNLILDIFANMGFVFGGVFLVYVAYKIYNAYIRLKKYNLEKDLILMFFCMVVPICWIQLELWSANNFWFLLLICANVTNSERYDNIKIDQGC